MLLFSSTNLVQLTLAVQEEGQAGVEDGEGWAWGYAGREGSVFVADQ